MTEAVWEGKQESFWLLRSLEPVNKEADAGKAEGLLWCCACWGCVFTAGTI